MMERNGREMGEDARWGRPDAVAMSPDGGALDRAFAKVREALRAHPGVDRWSLVRRQTKSRQLYLVSEQVEAERIGTSHGLEARVYTTDGRDLGQSSFSLALGEEAAAETRIAEAVRLARANQVPIYPMPGAADLPAVETIDREIAERPARVLESLRAELTDAVAGDRRIHVASAELFVFHDEVWMENSEGLVADLSGSRSTAEVVLLGRGTNGAESEVQDLRYRRRASDLEIGSWTRALGEQAKDATRAEAMRSWAGPVVLRADEMPSFLGPVTDRIEGQTVYRKMNHLEQGDPVSEEGFRGDRLTIATDRTLPYGLSTAPCDGEGVPAARHVVVEDGVVRRYWADARYAHYLGIEPTGSWANLAVDPGSRAAATLVSGDEVLEVVRFSWFTPSRGTGDFASEMRFGYLHRNGARSPVKGGAVTGNVFRALGHAYLSREREFVGRAWVPARIRLEDLRVAGA